MPAYTKLTKFFDAAKCSCMRKSDYVYPLESNYDESSEFLTTDEKEILLAYFRAIELTNLPGLERMLDRFTESRLAEEHFVGYVSSGRLKIFGDITDMLSIFRLPCWISSFRVHMQSWAAI